MISRYANNPSRAALVAEIAAQRIYADTAKFFYDPLGGDRFGGIWDPSITKPLPFRVMNRFSSIPATKVGHKPAPGKVAKLIDPLSGEF